MNSDTPTPSAPKFNKWPVISGIAVVTLGVAAWFVWPSIVVRRNVAAFREQAQQAFLRTEWFEAIKALQQAAQLRPTDGEVRRDYEDMQDKWLRFVEESLTTRKLTEAHAFLTSADTARILSLLTEPVRTKAANLVERTRQRALTSVKDAITRAATEHGAAKGGRDTMAEPLRRANAALDEVQELAGLAQAEFDEMRARIVESDWNSRINDAILSPRNLSDGTVTGAAAYAKAVREGLARLLVELDKLPYPPAVTEKSRALTQQAIDEQALEEWGVKLKGALMEAGVDLEKPIDAAVLQATHRKVREEFERAKGLISNRAFTRISDEISASEYIWESFRLLQLAQAAFEKSQAADFDAAFALYDKGLAAVRIHEASEGRQANLRLEKAKFEKEKADRVAQGEKDAKEREFEDDGLTAERWEKLRAEIIRLMEVHNLDRLGAALAANQPAEAQAIIEQYARYSGRNITVTGEAFVGEKDFEKFLGHLVELNLSPANGASRTGYGDLFLVEKLADRFTEQPGRVQHFIAQTYASWARALLPDRPGLALYVSHLGARASGLLDEELEARAVARLAEKYPQAIHADRVVSGQAQLASVIAPAWSRLQNALQDATRGWVKWQQGESDPATSIRLKAQVILKPVEKDQIEVPRSVRYQSGTRQVPNDAYDQLQNALAAVQREYNEGISAVDQAQAAFDQALAQGGNTSVVAAAALLTAKTALGYTQGKMDNIRSKLASTPRTLTEPSYDEEPYLAVYHRRNHVAELTLSLEAPGGSNVFDPILSSNLRYAAEEISGNTRRGVPAHKAVFLSESVVTSRLGAQLSAQFDAQQAFAALKIAKALDQAIATRAEVLGQPGGQGEEAVDFAWGRAVLWQKAGFNLGFEAAEKKVRMMLGLPGLPETVLAKPSDDGSTLVGYARENSLGLKFRPVPGVKVLVAETETRLQDFKQFVDDTGHKTTTKVASLGADGWKQRGATWANPGFVQDADHPVVCVSWEDAMAFCQWLTKKEREAGLIGSGQRYRLPTDAEWSILVGLTGEPEGTPAEKNGKVKDVYPWGKAWPVPVGTGNFSGLENLGRADRPNWTTMENYSDGFTHTAPVGSFAANSFGLRDLGGNVTEHTWEGVSRDSCFEYDTKELLMASVRGGGDKTFGSTAGGFRLVLSLSPDAEPETPEARAERHKAAQAERFKAAEQQAAAVPLQPFEGQSRNVADLKLTLLPVKPGYYLQGARPPAQGSEKEKAGYAVITRGFWLGQTEVTQGQWQAVMKTSLREHMQKTGAKDEDGFGADLPMYNVSWEDAMAFCRRLTERERAAGRLPAGYIYTLPTEAQWEYACRAGTTGDYAGDLDEMAWRLTNSGNKTHPVGQKRANAWGFHDMHGSVAEWCRDYFGDYPEGTRVDYAGSPFGLHRAYRGGGWRSSPDTMLRSAYRNAQEPGFRHRNCGFRVALVAQ